MSSSQEHLWVRDARNSHSTLTQQVDRVMAPMQQEAQTWQFNRTYQLMRVPPPRVAPARMLIPAQMCRALSDAGQG